MRGPSRTARWWSALLVAVLLAGLAAVAPSCAGLRCALKAHHQRRIPAAPPVAGSYQDEVIDGYVVRRFAVDADAAPIILLLHEVTGPNNESMELAGKLQREGFIVYLPRLFGELGRSDRSLGKLISVCANPKINCLFDTPSPAAIDMLTMSRTIMARYPGSLMGVIGMCLTGTFPLVVAENSRVAAIVLSQPALPVGRARASGVGQTTLDAVRDRGTPEEILYLRFSEDCLSPSEKFETLARALAPIRVTDGLQPSASAEHHSVLTESALETPEAFALLVDYLNRRLRR